jgi:hypothetical protein
MSDTKKLHSSYLLATAEDYERLFALLEWWVKPLLEREIERQRISSDIANHGWIAWLNTKQVVMAMLRSGLSAGEVIEMLEENYSRLG